MNWEGDCKIWTLQVGGVSVSFQLSGFMDTT